MLCSENYTFQKIYLFILFATQKDNYDKEVRKYLNGEET